jgi:hypothetical protein
MRTSFLLMNIHDINHGIRLYVNVFWRCVTTRYSVRILLEFVLSHSRSTTHSAATAVQPFPTYKVFVIQTLSAFA